MTKTMSSADHRAKPRRVVIKLGTGVITKGIGLLEHKRIKEVCAQVAALHANGTDVIIVSSGAVGLGMGQLGLKRRPFNLTRKQACAAVGQSILMRTWQEGFKSFGLTVGQILLTHEDLRSRDRHLAVKATIEALIGYGTIPILNENDTVSAAEIQAMVRFGDNDSLSALVASLMHAQYLFILSTAPGLIDYKNGGEIVRFIPKITPTIAAMAQGTKSETAVGGMVSKISAARIATRSGCGVFIASGAEKNIIPRLLQGDGPGTFFAPYGLPMEAKKRWIAYFHRPTGTVFINECAIPVLRDQGRSLLAVGVTHAVGEFQKDDIVNISAPDGNVIARGKVTFSQSQIPSLAGKQSDEMRTLFPNRKHLEIIHRDNLALL